MKNINIKRSEKPVQNVYSCTGDCILRLEQL